jgi:hypothetical protein
MEYAHGSYCCGEGVRGLNISMGNQDTKSNGHGDRRYPLEL